MLDVGRMMLRRFSMWRPSNALPPPNLINSDRKITFKYKDSKIVKSPKDNQNLRWSTTEELQKEVIQAFRQVNDPMKKLKEKNRFISKMVSRKSIACQKSDKPTKQLKSPTLYDDVEVLVTSDDGQRFVVEIKTNERGVHRNHTGLESKMMFCKTIAAFYKNQEKATFDLDFSRRGSAPL